MTIFDDPYALFAAATSLISAVAALIVAVSTAIKTFKLKNALDAAKQRETYAVCPKCKKKIPLSELSFFLPSGAKDNDLDGIPDKDI